MAMRDATLVLPTKPCGEFPARPQDLAFCKLSLESSTWGRLRWFSSGVSQFLQFRTQRRPVLPVALTFSGFLGRAVEHARLSAHEQGADAVRAHRRKDFAYRVRDQVSLRARDRSARASRSPTSVEPG